MSSNTIYLVTGANRGIGKGIVEKILSRDDTTVIAAVRDTASASSKAINSLPTGHRSHVIVVRIDSLSDSSAGDAVTLLKTQHGIARIDVVIANAGISDYYGTAFKTPLSEVRNHYEVNLVGTLALAQASWPLLGASKKPIFVALSTAAASITDMEGIPLKTTAYGASKAALNYVVRKMHFENPELIAFAINPGWVQTDMGTTGALAQGMAEAPVTLQDSVNGIVQKVDTATREKTSGTFQSYDDMKFSW